MERSPPDWRNRWNFKFHGVSFLREPDPRTLETEPRGDASQGHIEYVQSEPGRVVGEPLRRMTPLETQALRLGRQEGRRMDRRIRGGQFRRRTGRHMEEGPWERRHQVPQDSQVGGWILTRQGSGRTLWRQAVAVLQPRPTGRCAQPRLP